MGYTVVPQTGYDNYLYGGFLVKREINKRLEMSAEVFSHAREGFAAAQTQASTMIDAGGYYHFKSPGLQLLFAYGHSIVAATGYRKTWQQAVGTFKRVPLLRCAAGQVPSNQVTPALPVQ